MLKKGLFMGPFFCCNGHFSMYHLDMPLIYGTETPTEYPYGDGCSEFHKYGMWFTEHKLAFAITYQNLEWTCLAFPETYGFERASSFWTVSSGPCKNPLTALRAAYILAKEKLNKFEEASVPVDTNNDVHLPPCED